MKTQDNLDRLIRYLREYPEPTAVVRVAMAGVMNSREAYEAAQYGVRHGVFVCHLDRLRKPDHAECCIHGSSQ